MMKCMQQWAANHGLLYTPPLPMQIERVHPPEVEFDSRCGILGCGSRFPAQERRDYHLIPGKKLPCCSECWDAMGFPPEFTDSEQFKATLP